MRKPQLREANQLPPGHTVRKWPSLEESPGLTAQPLTKAGAVLSDQIGGCPWSCTTQLHQGHCTEMLMRLNLQPGAAGSLECSKEREASSYKGSISV